MPNHLTKETLDLILALRPFTGPKGRGVIDTLISLADSSASLVEGLEITTLAEQARDLLTARIDSALSLFIILIVVWLVQVFTISPAQESEMPQA
ncbi:MAG TPA: hypothetical protein GX529_09710 [Firmicutes bacterium]|nr:hypothetical protein [Candidatus Fermentithermobacillaceae bacterium]